MLWTICVILLILWLLGLVSGYTMVESFTFSSSSPSLWCWSGLLRDEDDCRGMTLAGEGKVLEKEVVSRSGKLSNLRALSVEKIS